MFLYQPAEVGGVGRPAEHAGPSQHVFGAKPAHIERDFLDRKSVV